MQSSYHNQAIQSCYTQIGELLPTLDDTLVFAIVHIFLTGEMVRVDYKQAYSDWLKEMIGEMRNGK